MLASEEALHPIDYVEKNWMNEPYSGGCYTSVMGPKVATEYLRCGDLKYTGKKRDVPGAPSLFYRVIHLTVCMNIYVL